MIRCFLAISLPDDVSDALMDVQDGVRNARWIDEENLHLTLAFLGDCTPSQLTELDVELGRLRVEPFDLAIAGAGTFGGAKPHTLYAGLAESEPLARLHSRIGRVIREAGIKEATAGQTRKFHPHVTLAKCGGGVFPAQAIDWTLRHARLTAPPFTVYGFGLYRSDLGVRTAIYTELVTYPCLR